MWQRDLDPETSKLWAAAVWVTLPQRENLGRHLIIRITPGQSEKATRRCEHIQSHDWDHFILKS